MDHQTSSSQHLPAAVSTIDSTMSTPQASPNPVVAPRRTRARIGPPPVAREDWHIRMDTLRAEAMQNPRIANTTPAHLRRRQPRSLMPTELEKATFIPWLGSGHSSPALDRVHATMDDPFMEHPRTPVDISRGWRPTFDRVGPVIPQDDNDSDDSSSTIGPGDTDNVPAVQADTTRGDAPPDTTCDDLPAPAPAAGLSEQHDPLLYAALYQAMFVDGDDQDSSPAQSQGVSGVNDDEQGTQLTAANAQAVLSPDACLFVANLPTASDDVSIELALSEVFSQYGICFVKVKRDSGGMPVAFIQYKHAEHCQAAITSGRGADILGRPCRTEKARVQRCLYCTRKDGRALTEADIDEMTRLLKQHGEIEPPLRPSEAEKIYWDLSDGIFVQFQYFQACQDALQALRGHNEFSFLPQGRSGGHRKIVRHTREAPRIVPENNLGPEHASAGVRFSAAIYVGNLPAGTKQEDLVEIFGVHGVIFGVHVCTKMKGTYLETYAYILFSSIWAAESAVRYSKDNLVIKSKHARVDWKKSPGRLPASASTAAIYEAAAHQYALTGIATAMPPPVAAGLPAYGWQSTNQYVPRGEQRDFHSCQAVVAAAGVADALTAARVW